MSRCVLAGAGDGRRQRERTRQCNGGARGRCWGVCMAQGRRQRPGVRGHTRQRIRPARCITLLAVFCPGCCPHSPTSIARGPDGLVYHDMQHLSGWCSGSESPSSHRVLPVWSVAAGLPPCRCSGAARITCISRSSPESVLCVRRTPAEPQKGRWEHAPHDNRSDMQRDGAHR